MFPPFYDLKMRFRFYTECKAAVPYFFYSILSGIVNLRNLVELSEFKILLGRI